MAKEGTFQTPVFTKEILEMENSMAKETLLMQIIENMWGIGKMELLKEKEYFYGLMEIDMMGNM